MYMNHSFEKSSHLLLIIFVKSRAILGFYTTSFLVGFSENFPTFLVLVVRRVQLPQTPPRSEADRYHSRDAPRGWLRRSCGAKEALTRYIFRGKGEVGSVFDVPKANKMAVVVHSFPKSV